MALSLRTRNYMVLGALIATLGITYQGARYVIMGPTPVRALRCRPLLVILYRRPFAATAPWPPLRLDFYSAQ